MAKNEFGLTPKQEAFCQEFLIDLNATAAAARAGFSQKTANEQSAQLMKKPEVRSRIEGLMAERAHRVETSADEVLRLLLEVARADLGKLYDGEGKILHPSQMDEATRRACAAIDVFEEFEFLDKERVQVGVTKKVKLWDKMRALELLGKHFKIFTDRVEHSGSLTLEQLVASSASQDEE